MVQQIPVTATRYEREVAEVSERIDDARASLGAPFKHATMLEDATRSLGEVNAQIASIEKQNAAEKVGQSTLDSDTSESPARRAISRGMTELSSAEQLASD